MLHMAKAKKARQNVRHAKDLYGPGGELLGEAVDVQNPDNPKETLRAFRAATTIRRLLHRKAISQDQFDAGKRFSESFAHARMGPRYCLTNSDRIMVDVSTRNPEQMIADSIAAQECWSALDDMATELSKSMLEHVVGDDMTISEWIVKRARPNLWGSTVDPTSAGFLIKEVLGGLVRFYRQYDRRH